MAHTKSLDCLCQDTAEETEIIGGLEGAFTCL
eukprot:SAG11_NODE_13893_length_634_cov_1.639252_3_plen_31_part_01